MLKIGPFLQLSGLRFAPNTGKDQSKYQAGFAWWPREHRINVKLGLGRVKNGSDPRRLQVVLQTQFYLY